MRFTMTQLSDLAHAGFDEIIDARSPSEFAEDHLPGAISLPVLDDDERARVGTMYVRQSRFGARKMGAALVLRNVAHHLGTTLAERDGAWRPLVYCWRGGQRSGTFGWLLREIGWRAETLEGGYRTYRRLVVHELYEKPLPHPLVVLEGMTCTAKTELLLRLRATGSQVVDLEGLARHRGSIFGAQADPQPSQKAFESALAQVLAGFDPARPVIVEAESSKVGDLIVPPQLWSAMCAAPRVAIAAPLAARAAFFTDAYADLVADPLRFSARIDQLKRLHDGDRIAAWQSLVQAGAFAEVASGLMDQHYDPRYAKSAARHADAVTGTLVLDALDSDALDAALPDLQAAIAAATR